MKIITGATGTAHVTSDDDRQFNMAIWGNGDYVLPNGSKFARTIVDANTVRIADGDLVMQGCHARIKPNTVETVTIETGTLMKKRVDTIVARYRLDTGTGYESVSLAVVKGTEADVSGSSYPNPPTIQNETILRDGATIHEMALYNVYLDGVSLVGVVPAYTEVKHLGGLVSDLYNIYYSTLFAGYTTVVLEDDKIRTNSIIEPFYRYVSSNPSSDSVINCNTMVVEDGKVTMTFDPLEDSIDVGIRVINNYEEISTAKG